ncbi:hypothetical protein HRR83_004424 [Exophiala dermatitidis]|uniref:Uncharacterized protein n=1 Tax=Exophiala dermatitidis TaxID=5970 RepID=A0AAN6EY39_EXODE|nr:hypothetical protein HRR75_003937 [Exophiala dermatitidis]KAJ4519552.1 hypothetical protein HRR74_004296 [Exophiala dermatitidis]KAJ4529370.1 hypothetical protein HRR73_000393 [Exophiala dermatitidis]KAJ4543976.1 hypothetical protein HRR76_002051 [Exophiala dermatitidis]KAJ4549149.1 hypothetical protein HRR77_004027 [Exophiala dermatitidis]
MQYSTSILCLLAATGALAAPHSQRSTNDTSVRVVLSDGGETGAQVSFDDSTVHNTGVPALDGPFATVELKLGADVPNKDLRCQILDDMGHPIVIQRGANTDITFSDADKGPWTFRNSSSLVSQVVCDPTFTQIDASASQLRVILEDQATETGSQTLLPAGQREESKPVGSMGPYETVELKVGELVEDQDYRCQVLDGHGQPIVVLRGENRDITFSDAGKGAWTFENRSEVSDIVCDPTFVKGSA